MTNEETIFAAALSKSSPAERQTFLDQACAGDLALRREVEMLLHAHERAAGILEASPVNLDGPTQTLAPAHGEAVGSTVGPYKLLEQIGGGGMGAVYMAEQLRPIRRKVALKIIKPGMDSGQVIARFEAERQALTMMDHENIAKVLDAGTTEAGRPYFVMELVRGIPITDYCDQARLTPRQRLALFVKVCSAVQHAHQKGVIHRDLKPGNILVTLHDDKPVPKVIDFGIAKATGQILTERTLFTNYAQMLGTPLYMSPEQAQISGLDVDTRSDVYSLGVLLYELLTGTTPFDKQRLREAAYDEMRRIIREEDPPKPSTRLDTMGPQITSVSQHRHTDPKKLGQLVRGELDWIVMRALEKERARRYETAIGLGRDVERYLNDETVHACPPSAAYRLRKIVRRHRVTIAVAAAFVLMLIGATVVSSWQALRARRAEALVQSQLKIEKEVRARAVTEAAKATAISDLLREMLSSADPYRAKGADYTVRQLLDDSAIRLKDQLKDQPEVEAAIRSAIGNAYHRVSMTDKAEPHLKRALEIRRALAKDAGSAGTGGNAAQEAFAQSLLDYSWNFFMSSRAREAEPFAREAVAIYKQCAVRDGRMLEALSTLQLILNRPQGHIEAVAVAEEALALGRRYLPDGHGELANILHRMADTKMSLGDLAAAEALARQAVAMHLHWHGKDHVETGWSLLILGTIQSARKDHVEAEVNLRRALPIFVMQYGDAHDSARVARERLQHVLEARGDQPALAALGAEKAARLSKAIELQGDQLSVRFQLADFLREAGDIDGAIAQHSAIVAKDPSNLAAWMARGDCYLRRGDLARAEEDYSAAIKLKPDQADAWTGRAFSHFHRQQWEAAIADFSKAIALGPAVHTNWFHRGRIYLELAQWDKAAADYTKALDGWPDDPWSRFHRAEAYSQLHRVEEAVADLRQAVDKGFRDVAGTELALAAMKAGAKFEPLRANQEFKKLVASLEESLPALRGPQAARLTDAAQRSPGSLAIQMELGDFLRDTGDLDGALRKYAEAVAQRPPGTTLTHDLKASLGDRFTHLARLFRDKRKFEQSAGAFQKAIAVREPIGPDSSAALRLSLSVDYNELAFLPVPGRQPGDAELAVRKAIELKQGLVKDFPENLDYRMHLAHSYLGLGHVSWPGKPEESTQAFSEVAAILNPLSAEKSASEGLRIWVGRTWWDLGSAWLKIERVDDAEKAQQQGLEMFVALAGAYPGNPLYRQEQASSQRRLATVASRAGRLEDAERELLEALRIYRELAAEAPDTASYRHDAAATTATLAGVHAQMGQLEKAAARLTEAVKTFEPADQLEIWRSLAMVRLAMGDEPGYRQACLALVERALPTNPDGNLASEIAFTCSVLPDVGVDFVEVVRIGERAVTRNPSDPDYLISLGAALYRAGRFEAAAKTLAAAEAAFRREEANPSPAIVVTTSILYSQLFLAMTHQRLGHHEEAAQWLKTAIEAVDEAPPTSQPAAGRMWKRGLTVGILRKEAQSLVNPTPR